MKLGKRDQPVTKGVMKAERVSGDNESSMLDQGRKELLRDIEAEEVADPKMGDRPSDSQHNSLRRLSSQASAPEIGGKSRKERKKWQQNLNENRFQNTGAAKVGNRGWQAETEGTEVKAR